MEKKLDRRTNYIVASLDLISRNNDDITERLRNNAEWFDTIEGAKAFIEKANRIGLDTSDIRIFAMYTETFITLENI